MPGDLAMGKGLAKGPSFERLTIVPKDVTLGEALKSPRKTHSSRFHVTERRELEKLPSLHGNYQRTLDATDIQMFRQITGQNCLSRNSNNAT